MLISLVFFVVLVFFVLFVFFPCLEHTVLHVCGAHSGQSCLCLEHTVLPVSLDFHFLISSSILINVHLTFQVTFEP